MSSQNAAQIAKLRAALGEIFSRRSVFSHDTYTQIVLAIYDRIRDLQSDAASVADESDEIRLVTVMFIDVLDSTQLAHQVGAEDWKLIIGEAYARLGALIREWDGEVAQYLGDGLLCFFGAHHSQEDDAVRAVYCALAMQEALAAYARELYDTYRIRFAARIGMSTGRVVVGMIGDEDKQELLALGTPTNLAARLQTLAEPGKVLIDSQTYYRVRKHFITQAHPLTQVKGFEAPVEYYTVLGRRQRRPTQLTLSQIAGIEMNFVGRNAECQRMMTVLEQALQDGGVWGLLVSGETGIGKSRLLQEVLLAAEEMPYRPLVMVAEFERREKSYSLLRYLLTMHCGLREDMPPEITEARIVQYITETWPHPDAEAVAHVIGFLTGLGFSGSLHVQAVHSGAPRQVAYAWITKWFRGLADSAPLLLVIDNLQWADSESLALLEYLASDLASAASPVVFLTAGREGTEPISGLSRLTYIPLVPLADSDIAAVIETVLQYVDNVPATLRQVIKARAQGNPLFVEEFLLMLFDSGAFEMGENGRWQTNRYKLASLTFNMPNNLLGLLQARLDELPATVRRIVQTASVMGQTFWEGALAEVSGLENLTPVLRDLMTRGIILRQHDSESGFEGEREYTFRHTLYPEVAYSMLTRPVREAYHRDFAAWLAARVFTHPDYLGMLAEHYSKGQQPQEALASYLAAAQYAYRRGLMRETLEMIERGQAAARDVPREIALPFVSQLWMLQGQALESLDRYEESCAASQSALMLMDELPPSDMVAERVTAARTLGSAHLNLGHYDEAFKALSNAHSLLPKENVQQHAAILRTYGTLFFTRGQLTESLTFQEQALKLAQESGDTREIARVMAMLGAVELDRGAFVHALDLFEQVLEMNRQTGNLYYQVLDLRHIASIYRSLFAYDLSLEVCEQAEELQTRIRYQDPLLKTSRGLNLIALGQHDAGLRLLREAMQGVYQNVLTRWRVQLSLVNGLGVIGDYEACRAAASALADTTRDHNYIVYGRAMLWLGVALNALGEKQAAQAALREALEHESTYGGRDLWMCYSALSAFEAGCHDQMRQTLHAVADSLQTRPDLQAAFLNSPVMRAL